MLRSVARTPHQQLLHEAAIRPNRLVRIALLDGAAPSRGLNPTTAFCYGTCFATLIPKLLSVAPLNLARPFPVSTMAPDKADHAACPPDQIREQFRQVISSCTPRFEDRDIQALDRTDAYNWARSADLVIVAADERHDYANLGLIVDPADGPLADLPQELTPALAMEMQLCGHSNKIVVTGSNSPWREHLRSSEQLIEVGNHSTVLETVKAITEEWVPNFSELPEDFAVRFSLAACRVDLSHENQIATAFQDDWSAIGPPVRIGTAEMQRELGHWYVAALVETAEVTDLAVVITNGVTREPLQGKYVANSGA